MGIKDFFKNWGKSRKNSPHASNSIPLLDMLEEEIEKGKKIAQESDEWLKSMEKEHHEAMGFANKADKIIHKIEKETDIDNIHAIVNKEVRKDTKNDLKNMTRKERVEYQKDLNNPEISSEQMLYKWQDKLSKISVESLIEAVAMETLTDEQLAIYHEAKESERVMAEFQKVGYPREMTEMLLDNPDQFVEQTNAMGIDPDEVDQALTALSKESDQKLTAMSSESNSNEVLNYNELLAEDKKNTVKQKDSSIKVRPPSVPKTEVRRKPDQASTEKPPKTRELV